MNGLCQKGRKPFRGEAAANGIRWLHTEIIEGVSIENRNSAKAGCHFIRKPCKN